MALAGGIGTVLGFLIFVKLFRLVEKSMMTINLAHKSMTIVRDTNLDAHQKEIVLQKNAKELFYLFFIITAGSTVALAIPFGLIWLLEIAGLVTVDEVIGTTLSLEFIVATVIISFGAFWLMRKKQ